jgi:hypothetical protein
LFDIQEGGEPKPRGSDIMDLVDFLTEVRTRYHRQLTDPPFINREAMR